MKLITFLLTSLRGRLKIVHMTFFLRFLAVLMAIGLIGCAAFRPSIQDRFPGGYSRLIHAAPECGKPDAETREGCMTAAEIYEQSDPRKATLIFIRHWDKTVWSLERSGPQSPQVTRRIVIPALAFQYDAFPGEYSASMRAELKGVLLDSLISFDSFQKAHDKAASSSQNLR